MKSLLKAHKIIYKQNPSGEEGHELESTFITGGCANPSVECDNCQKEIPRAKLQLHLAYCLKNVKKCGFCHKPCHVDEMGKHLEASKGDYFEIKKAIEDQDLS